MSRRYVIEVCERELNRYEGELKELKRRAIESDNETERFACAYWAIELEQEMIQFRNDVKEHLVRCHECQEFCKQKCFV